MFYCDIIPAVCFPELVHSILFGSISGIIPINTIEIAVSKSKDSCPRTQLTQYLRPLGRV